MRKVKINDLLRFVKQNSIMHKGQSNNAVRTFIWKGLKNNNLFFVHSGSQLVGLIEWFRYPDLNMLAEAFKSRRLDQIKGPVLYINNYTFKPTAFSREVLRRFFRFQAKIGEVENIFIMKMKDKQFSIKELKIRR